MLDRALEAMWNVTVNTVPDDSKELCLCCVLKSLKEKVQCLCADTGPHFLSGEQMVNAHPCASKLQQLPWK